MLVSQRGNEKCQPHSFSVTAMNDAGSDPVSTIMDSIPICEAMSQCMYCTSHASMLY